MGSLVQLKNIDPAIIDKTIYDEIEDLPFMKSYIPLVTLVTTYLLFVLKIGPAFMQNRKPYSLKKTLVVYNVFQVALSLYLLLRYANFIRRTGIIYTKCQMIEYDTRQETLWNIWWYIAAKATELLDTVFFVLRKKYNQTSFLHIYHHTLMLTATWIFLKLAPSDLVCFSGALNSFVHVFMYLYYALAALGPHMNKYLTWKKHMTKLQLVQFVGCIFVFVGNLVYNECPPSKYVAAFLIINCIFFLYLFGKFYYKNYVKINNERTKKSLNITE